jgi:uncharacterized protein YecE (DUF72 family)
MPGSVTQPEPIGPFVYVRFHGASGRYRGGYPDDDLRTWARRLRTWAKERACFVYFNNDVGGHAPRDAAMLRNLVAD